SAGLLSNGTDPRIVGAAHSCEGFEGCAAGADATAYDDSDEIPFAAAATDRPGWEVRGRELGADRAARAGAGARAARRDPPAGAGQCASGGDVIRAVARAAAAGPARRERRTERGPDPRARPGASGERHGQADRSDQGLEPF